MPALIRFVECKCLLGGVTTSQGVELFSNAGARRYYRGVVRNVEQTEQADLPEAATKIADVEASDVEKFFQRLLKQSCFLLHLSEGTDAAAREHFLALKRAGGNWAVAPALAGIHCAALKAADFKVLGDNGGSMVWSPLSNLLLYGATADVASAKAAGVRIGIGSDWSPSGSKNLLGELKVARVVSAHSGNLFTDRELVAMATRTAARILRWDAVLGSIEPGKRADLLVIDGAGGDPYAALLEARETAIRLVMINGVPRYGVPALMGKFAMAGEPVRVGSSPRVLFLDQETADPAVGPVTLAEAKKLLTDALKRLPELAKKLEAAPPPPAAFAPAAGKPVWSLVLDEIEETGVELRPRLPFASHRHTGPSPVPMNAAMAAALAKPISQIVKPLKLDALTVADDPDFLDRLAAEKNLPPFLAPGVKALYS
jgi:hypothetical protein